MPLTPLEVRVGSVNIVNLKTCFKSSGYTLKLHQEFALHSTKKLGNSYGIMDVTSTAKSQYLGGKLLHWVKTWELWIAYKHTPLKPVTSLLLGNKFNQCVAMDLKLNQ